MYRDLERNSETEADYASIHFALMQHCSIYNCVKALLSVLLKWIFRQLHAPNCIIQKFQESLSQCSVFNRGVQFLVLRETSRHKHLVLSNTDKFFWHIFAFLTCTTNVYAQSVFIVPQEI